MSERRIVDLCRTCLREDIPTVSVFNVVDVSRTIRISDMLYDFTSIHISESDKFSTKVCSYCVLNIKNSYDFKKICLESEQKLLNYVPSDYFSTSFEYDKDCKRIIPDNLSITNLNSAVVVENSGVKNLLLQLEKTVCCDYCTKSFCYKSDLERHIHLEHGLPDESSRDTDYEENSLSSGNNLSVKLENQSPERNVSLTSEKVFICGKCDLKFEKKIFLTQHNATIHADNINNSETLDDSQFSKVSYSCDDCSIVFLQKINYFRHMKTHQPSSHMCMFCGKTFTTIDLLQSHRKSHKKIFKCVVCEVVFDNGRALSSHRKAHQKSKDPHLCPTCGKAFTTKGNLNAHIRIHSGEKPYVCKVCDKAFASWSALNLHKPAHSDERNFVCTICGSKQKRRSALQAHMRQHTGERKYECTACEKKFFSSAALKDHSAMHTGEKNHLCTTCGKAFSRKKALVVHSRSHSEERPFVCSVCGRAFTQRVVLRTHMRTHQ